MAITRGLKSTTLHSYRSLYHHHHHHHLVFLVLGFISLIDQLQGWPSSASAAATDFDSITPQVVTDRTDGLCASLITSQGDYNCIEYMVPTQDGFLLGLQRMSSKKANTKAVVFLMHGLMVGGDVWVLNSPSESLGFILADAGYDVWIGNTRTTRFSYGHSSYQRSNNGFWDWSVDEMAGQDLPAMLGWVFQVTGQKVHYIGYSQGSQQAFIAFSQGQLSSYVDKVVMLAPVAYVDHGKAPIETGLFDLHIDEILEAANIHEFDSQSGSHIGELLCGKSDESCYKTWIQFFAGENCCLNLTKLDVLEKYEPQSTSVKNLAHLAQQGRNSNFAKFDYGLFGNLKRYGKIWPPSYHVANIPTNNMFLINGLKDALADPIDVARLVSEMGGNVLIHTSPNFGHLDFILADSANSEIYNRILLFLQGN